MFINQRLEKEVYTSSLLYLFALSSTGGKIWFQFLNYYL